MSPLGFGKAKQEKKSKKKKGKLEHDGNFTWFETTVNGGVVILNGIRDAAAFIPVPYLRSAAGLTVNIIGIIQLMKDNNNDFRRLGEDAAMLTAAIIQSYYKSDDQEHWPGEKLKSVVDELLSVLGSIETFATEQVERRGYLRVLNSAGDGNKIKEFRERLGAAMDHFGLTAHLESYELLRLIKGMMEEYTASLKEPPRPPNLDVEDVPDAKEPPVVPIPKEVDEGTSNDEALSAQLIQDEELARELEKSEHRRGDKLTSMGKRGLEEEAAKYREFVAAQKKRTQEAAKRQGAAAAAAAATEQTSEAAKRREAAAAAEAAAAKERALEVEKKQRELQAEKDRRERESAEEKVRTILRVVEEQAQKCKGEGEQQQHQQPKPVQAPRRRAKHEEEEEATSEDDDADDGDDGDDDDDDDDDSSSDDEMVKWAMKEATAKRKAREAERKARGPSLHEQFGAIHINNVGYGAAGAGAMFAGPGYYPHANPMSYYGGGGPFPAGMGGYTSSIGSGNVTTTVKQNVGNDNSTYIKKVIKRGR